MSIALWGFKLRYRSRSDPLSTNDKGKMVILKEQLFYDGIVVFVFSIGERTRLLTWGYEGMRLKVVLEPSDEGGYTVYVPSLPGCISEGETVQDAMKNIREAIRLYLEPIDDDLVLDERAEVEEVEI